MGIDFFRDLGIYKVKFKHAITYRFSMMISIISGPLLMFVNYVIWKSIFEATGKEVISGFTFDGMVVYVVISFVTSYLIYDNVTMAFRNGVRSGSLGMDLLRPVSFIWFEFMKKVSERSLALLIEFIPVMVIMGFMFGKDVVLGGNFVYYVLAVVIAFIVSFLLNCLIGIVSFWIVEPRGIMKIYTYLSFLLHGGLLPLSLFPGVLQKVFFYLPFQFVRFVPARMFMGSYELAGKVIHPLYVLGYGVSYIIVLLVLVILFWRVSIKKFCGVGV